MLELCGQDYIKFIEGLDNDKAIYELIKQAVIYNGLAQQEAVTEDDVFRYNAITNEVYKRMNQRAISPLLFFIQIRRIVVDFHCVLVYNSNILRNGRRCQNE